MEAKYPALLFKQQLDAFVQKIFPMLRDNVKKEITPQLAACIHAPRTATTRSRRTMNPGQPSDSQGTLGGVGEPLLPACLPLPLGMTCQLWTTADGIVVRGPPADNDLPVMARCQAQCSQLARKHCQCGVPQVWPLCLQTAACGCCQLASLDAWS